MRLLIKKLPTKALKESKITFWYKFFSNANLSRFPFQNGGKCRHPIPIKFQGKNVKHRQKKETHNYKENKLWFICLIFVCLWIFCKYGVVQNNLKPKIKIKRFMVFLITNNLHMKKIADEEWISTLLSSNRSSQSFH